MSKPTARLVVLSSGVTIPPEAVTLAYRLQGDGMTLAPAENGKLSVGPSDKLTDEDCRAIRRHKPALLKLLDHESSQAEF